MLNKKMFEDGLTEIEIAFNGFSMTKQRADIWYKYSKHLEDSQWESKIARCIKGCRKVPTLADILDFNGYYQDDTITPSGYGDYKYEESPKHSKMPDGFKEHMDKVLANIKMPSN